MGWSLHAVLWFLQSRDKMINNKNEKDKEIKVDNELKEKIEKRERKIEINDKKVMRTKEIMKMINRYKLRGIRLTFNKEGQSKEIDK